jgi:hypothetical protein
MQTRSDSECELNVLDCPGRAGVRPSRPLANGVDSEIMSRTSCTKVAHKASRRRGNRYGMQTIPSDSLGAGASISCFQQARPHQARRSSAGPAASGKRKAFRRIRRAAIQSANLNFWIARAGVWLSRESEVGHVRSRKGNLKSAMRGPRFDELLTSSGIEGGLQYQYRLGRSSTETDHLAALSKLPTRPR